MTVGRGADETLYGVLEVSPNASFDEIESSYERLMTYLAVDSMALYSMGVDPDEVAEQRTRVEEAFRILSDPQLRAAYDDARRGGENYPSIMVPESPSDGDTSISIGQFEDGFDGFGDDGAAFTEEVLPVLMRGGDAPTDPQPSGTHVDQPGSDERHQDHPSPQLEGGGSTVRGQGTEPAASQIDESVAGRVEGPAANRDKGSLPSHAGETTADWGKSPAPNSADKPGASHPTGGGAQMSVTGKVPSREKMAVGDAPSSGVEGPMEPAQDRPTKTAAGSPVAALPPPEPAPLPRAEQNPQKAEPAPLPRADPTPPPRSEPRPPKILPAGARERARPGRRRLHPSVEPPIIGSDTEIGGGVLKRLRESCDASLQEVAAITKINKRYLRAIEDNEYAVLPAKVYVRGFVSEYARVLGLDPQAVARGYLRLYERYKSEGGRG